MKKNLFVLFTLLLALGGCNKIEVNKKKENAVTISLGKKELTLTAGESYQFEVTTTPAGASLDEVYWDIVNYQPALDKKYEKPTIRNGFLLSNEGGTLDVVCIAYSEFGQMVSDTCKVRYLVSKEEVYRKYCYDYAVKDTAGLLSGEKILFKPASYAGDTTYLIGFKKDTIWIGLFNKQTKQQIDEWMDIEPTSRTQKVHISYGQYKEITINDPRIESFSKDGDNTALLMDLSGSSASFYGAYNMLCFGKDKKVKKYFYKGTNYDGIMKWHENSYVLNIDVSQEPYEAIDNVYTCFSDAGEVLSSGLIPRELKEIWFPTGFDDFIYVSKPYASLNFKNLYICRWSLSKGKSIWSTSFGYEIESDVRYTPSIAKRNGDIWTFDIRLTPPSGRAYTLTYDVNINDGTTVRIK